MLVLGQWEVLSDTAEQQVFLVESHQWWPNIYLITGLFKAVLQADKKHNK